MMKVPEMKENAMIHSFSSTKRRIIILLKREGEMDLKTLAEKLEITKMGVLNHIKDMEAMEIIERVKIRSGVGRPRIAFKLSKNSRDIFPKAYSTLTTSVLEFVEEQLGREAVYKALQKRQAEILDMYQENVEGEDFHDRIKSFAELRDRDGYMVELNMMPQGKSYEIIEYNCPILSIADKYPEACQIEQELFEKLLGADVETIHRTVDGDNLCRFLIKLKKQ